MFNDVSWNGLNHNLWHEIMMYAGNMIFSEKGYNKAITKTRNKNIPICEIIIQIILVGYAGKRRKTQFHSKPLRLKSWRSVISRDTHRY